MSEPRRNDFLIPTIAVAIDATAIVCSFLLAYWVRFRTDLLSFLPLAGAEPPFEAYLYGSLVITPVWLMIFNSQKMYAARRNVALSDEFFNIVKLVTIGMLVVMGAAFFYRAFSYSRAVFGLLWLISVTTIFSGRVLLQHIERALYRSKLELRNAVIIGNNETANLIVQNLDNHPLLGYRLVGYFADQPRRRGARRADSRLEGLPYLGTLRKAPGKMIDENVELALISLDYTSYPQLYELVRECEGVNVEFMMVPDLVEIMTGGMQVKEIEGIPFIRIKGVPMTTWGRISKRAFDILFSGLFLSLLAPLLIVIALVIKIGSDGPVLFRQERVGLDGKRFVMLKFRSMRIGADKHDAQAGLGQANDPRQTGVGSFIRKLSFDELPQLINVLKGEMSLVGPRPERPYFVDQFKNLVPKYLDRHRVKTGMTGWAQVNGLRGNTSLKERIRYDLYYIENWSLWFDMKILMKTAHALFGSKPAY